MLNTGVWGRQKTLRNREGPEEEEQTKLGEVESEKREKKLSQNLRRKRRLGRGKLVRTMRRVGIVKIRVRV